METFDTIAVLLTLAAAFAYLNHRFVRLPMTIGLMLMSLVASAVLILLEQFGLPAKHYADQLIGGIDFNKVLMEGMLGLLLFAGALFVNLDDLIDNRLEVGIFATLGVIASTFLVGGAVYAMSNWLGYGLRVIDCLLFGALISPTDPIAVLRILKRAGAPRGLEAKVAGESLFNDGIGVVVFLVILKVATGGGTHGEEITARQVAILFGQEAFGGALFGLLAGYLTYRILKSVNHAQVEILITLALVTGGYALALSLHLSAPIAMVIAGLLIGNRGRRLAMSEQTREHLDTFWELIDEILNAVLFVLIGLEVLVLTLSGQYLLAGLMAIPIALAARLISIGIPVWVLRRWRRFTPGAAVILTWGGLRGGISVALALSLPPSPARDLILTMAYVVVVFSIIVQGTTIKALVGRLVGGRSTVT